MKTIDKILEYNLSYEEKKALYECWICNWIGGKWANIENLIENILEILPYFDKKKKTKLIQDMIELANEHDIQTRFKMWFTKSNYKFAKKVYHLLHWCKFKHRIWFAFVIFILMQRLGKTYYFK